MKNQVGILTVVAAKATNKISGQAAYPSSGLKTRLSSKVSSLNHGRVTISHHG